MSLRRELHIETATLDACPQCGGRALHDLGRVSYGRSPIEFSGERIDVSQLDARLHECDGCALRFTSPVLSPRVTRDLYARSRPTRWADGTARFESTLRKARLEIPRADKKVLDFGCFTGDLLGCFKQRGWSTSGIDLCEAAVDEARRRGHDARAGDHEAIASMPGPFDVVTLFDVIEHVVDPQPMLRALRDAMAPRGELWILTGDAGSWPSRVLRSKWWYVSFCEHVVFYRESTIATALARVGLRVSRIARLRYLDEPLVRTARNYAATGAYAALHRFAVGRVHNRLGDGPPPLLPATDHLLVVAVRA